jgi:hypothetical protein
MRLCAAQIRCTEHSDTPVAAIARAVRCVISPGGSTSVSATTRSIGAGDNGGKPGFRVFSRKQARRALAHEPLLPAPDTRLRDLAATHNFRRAAGLGGEMIPARQTCFFGLLRSATPLLIARGPRHSPQRGSPRAGAVSHTCPAMESYHCATGANLEDHTYGVAQPFAVCML